MKRLLVLLFAFMLVLTGCSGGQTGETDVVDENNGEETADVVETHVDCKQLAEDKWLAESKRLQKEAEGKGFEDKRGTVHDFVMISEDEYFHYVKKIDITEDNWSDFIVVNTKNNLDAFGEVIDTYEELGFIDNAAGLLNEDQVAVKLHNNKYDLDFVFPGSYAMEAGEDGIVRMCVDDGKGNLVPFYQDEYTCVKAKGYVFVSYLPEEVINEGFGGGIGTEGRWYCFKPSRMNQLYVWVQGINDFADYETLINSYYN